ncbi:sulfonate transport system substrate-binding protein [Actinocorallia herbida]|uniref:Sulfonate transport system substrate-binding protein n=1 Tax=Actinocorallia herbida TaxID=58109 RepID=A0A3N1CZN1_9ACTN|nr:PhnD/SsuA/transferrin family substrate-binding protein [Actinocorallia herbida]ROO86696.1 sulfonate transport system substrate-binding protein [Actinocorallia herbida]
MIGSRLLLAAAAATALLASACTGAEPPGGGADDGDLSSTKLAVSVGATTNAFLKTANEFDTPYTVEEVNASTPKDLASALASGRADLLLLGDVITSTLAGQDLPFTIVYAQQRAKGFCGVLVPKGSTAKTVADLRGKTVGNGVSTAGEIIAIRSFQRAGLDYLKDVEKVDLATIPEQQAAFVSGKVDALATCTPPGGSLVAEGKARWLVTGEDGLWNAQNYWVLSDKAREDPKKVEAALDYITRFKKSLTYTNAHTDELLAQLSKATQVPAEQLRLSFADPIQPVPLDASVTQGLQDTYDALATTGRVKSGVAVADHFDAQYNDRIGE